MVTASPDPLVIDPQSPLASLPTPEAIRERMNRNVEENRQLRSLFILSRRVREQSRQSAEHGSEAHQ